MTNLQLVLTICIPSLLIVLSWLQQAARTARLEATVDRKFDNVDKQFTEMRHEMVALRDNFHREMIALRDSIHRDMVFVARAGRGR